MRVNNQRLWIGWAVGGVVLLSLLSAQLDSDGRWATNRRWVGWWLQPGIRAVEWSEKQWRQISGAVTFWWGGWQRLAQTEAAWREWRRTSLSLAELEKENAVLRAALHWQQAKQQTVFAWHGSGSWWWVAAGCQQGAVAGTAVVVDRAIVGTVSRTSYQESVVATVTDPDWRLNVLVGTAAAQGVFTTQRGTPQVEELVPTVKLAAGETVVTAGQPGVPRGLVVGTVTNVRTEPSRATQTAVVLPAIFPQDVAWVQLAESPAAGAVCP